MARNGCRFGLLPPFRLGLLKNTAVLIGEIPTSELNTPRALPDNGRALPRYT